MSLLQNQFCLNFRQLFKKLPFDAAAVVFVAAVVIDIVFVADDAVAAVVFVAVVTTIVFVAVAAVIFVVDVAVIFVAVAAVIFVVDVAVTDAPSLITSHAFSCQVIDRLQ